MSSPKRPLFYQPVFGNDNMIAGQDVVDIAAFTAPMKREDVAITQPKKLSEKLK